MKKALLTLVLALACFALEAKLTPCHLFSDAMVLQQQSEVPVWGTADPGAKISISASWGASASCRADASGSWRATLKTPAAGYRNHTVTISSGSEKIVIKDVLIGEVWIASGQSNMQIPLRGFFNCPIEDALEYISAPAIPDRVRMYTVPMTRSYEPVTEIEGSWEKSEPQSRKEMSAVAYFFALKLNSVLNVPVGIVACPYGGAKVESWTPREILETYPDVDLREEAIKSLTPEYIRPMVMYNAMLYPIRTYAAKGFIWYQGCSNVGEDSRFVDRMTKMVDAWRRDWNDSECEMPFYTVEIAPFRYSSDSQHETSPALRQAQHDAVKVIPNSAIVVTNDLVENYEKDNIHPARKKPIGDRLANLALHRDYGYTDIACYSPEAVRLVKLPKSNEIGVELSDCPNGLNRSMEIEGLEVAGDDNVYYPVTSASYEWELKLLRVHSESVFNPKHVRYGWGDFRPGNLYNCEGLPVSPFCL